MQKRTPVISSLGKTKEKGKTVAKRRAVLRKGILSVI